MLRLVHPAPAGKVYTRPKGRKSPALTPTPDEQKRIHATIKNLIRAYGGRDVLAAVLGVSPNNFHHRQPRSYSFAVILARAAGIPVEQLLAGKPQEAGACFLCGRKGGTP